MAVPNISGLGYFKGLNVSPLGGFYVSATASDTDDVISSTSISIGSTNPTSIYVGNTQVNQVYVGSTKVFG